MIKDALFLRHYEQELRFLRDLAGEFASAHARLAGRFGLDADGCADPHVEWLLDGAAFLAARVQHKLGGASRSQPRPSGGEPARHGAAPRGAEQPFAAGSGSHGPVCKEITASS